MTSQHRTDPEKLPQREKVAESRKFSHWMGERRNGEWMREAIACPEVKRTFTKHTKSTTERDEHGKPKIVEVEVEEIVYAHQGYHPHLEGEKKARKAFFFRGARVWR